jgi:hypothetical protein
LRVDYLSIFALQTSRDPLFKLGDHGGQLFVAQTPSRIDMLDLLLSRHEQDRELAIRCWLRLTQFGKSVIAVRAPIAQKARYHLLTQSVTRAELSPGRVA